MMKQRVHIPGGIYHITQRGNLKKNIFFVDEDRAYFCLLMQRYFSKYNHRIHAFCLMDNHIHILAQAGPLPFGKAMQCITSTYARRINKRFKTSGHRFQGRFFSRIVEVDAYLLTLLKYIHMNPVKAKMVSSPDQYHWSTHNHYILNDNIPWVERDFSLNLFDDNRQNAARGYSQFMELDLTEEQIRKIEEPAHGYIIGNDDFISRVQAQAEKITIIRTLDLETILRVSSEYFYYPVQSVKRSGKNQLAAKIRGIAGYIVRHHTEISQTALADLTHRSASSISQSIKTIETKLAVDSDLQKNIDDIIDRIIFGS